jgi:hypothetical protein
MRLSIEKIARVYDDDHGHYWQVGPDGDGLDLVELRSVGSDGKVVERLTLPTEVAAMICPLIIELVKQLDAQRQLAQSDGGAT